MENGGNPVHVGAIMLYFTKKEETFSRFALEILTCNANIKNLKTIGIDLESIICTDECHSNTLQINICEAFNEKRQEKACGTTT